MTIDNKAYAELFGVHKHVLNIIGRCGGFDEVEAVHPELYDTVNGLYAVLAGDSINVAYEMERRGIDTDWIGANMKLLPDDEEGESQ